MKEKKEKKKKKAIVSGSLKLGLKSGQTSRLKRRNKNETELMNRSENRSLAAALQTDRQTLARPG